MKTKNNTNKKGAILLVLPVILAVLLIVALLVGVGGRTKTVYIKPPATASSDFSGTMLADYDNLYLNVNTRSLQFNFDDIELSDYDFVVMDIMSAKLQPNDSYTIRLSLDFDDESLSMVNSFIGISAAEGYAFYSEPYFIVGSNIIAPRFRLLIIPIFLICVMSKMVR